MLSNIKIINKVDHPEITSLVTEKHSIGDNNSFNIFIVSLDNVPITFNKSVILRINICKQTDIHITC